MPRLRRVDCGEQGIHRRRHGRGFSYVDACGERIDDPDTLERIGNLAIPPAWKDVWICPYPTGHIQATGFDAAGRKQYRYHDAWRTRRDADKFESMVGFAKALPALREQVENDLTLDGMPRERALACAVRLLDRGSFRIGSEDYAEDNGTYGLATMRKEHVTVRGDTVAFDYEAKGGLRRRQRVIDADAAGGGRRAAGIPRRAALARRPLRGHQRLPQGRERRCVLRQGLPHLERDGALGDRPRRLRAGGRRLQDGTQAGDEAGGRRGVAPP